MSYTKQEKLYNEIIKIIIVKISFSFFGINENFFIFYFSSSLSCFNFVNCTLKRNAFFRLPSLYTLITHFAVQKQFSSNFPGNSPHITLHKIIMYEKDHHNYVDCITELLGQDPF